MAVLTARGLLVDSGQEQPRASYRADLVTVLLGLWFVVGLFLDAWAHNNVPGLETFFTPWHAVFYSGFAATAGWICVLLWRQARTGRRGAAAVPVASTQVGHLPTVVEYWTGVPVVAALSGLLIAVLLVPGTQQHLAAKD